MKNQSLIFASLALMIFAFSSCRKEEPRIISSSLTELNIPESCTNGVLDANEWYVDCGGICPVCDSPQVPCENVVNTLLVDGQSLTMNVSCNSSGATPTITGVASGHTLTLTFPDLFNDQTVGPPGARAINSSAFPIGLEVRVTLTVQGNLLVAGSGSAYISYNANGVVVDLCNVTASANVGFSTIQRTFSGQMNCTF